MVGAAGVNWIFNILYYIVFAYPTFNGWFPTKNKKQLIKTLNLRILRDLSRGHSNRMLKMNTSFAWERSYQIKLEYF